MKIFLDMDEVVADFKGYAGSVLGHNVYSIRYPDDEWNKLLANPRLYRDLPLKAGANELVEWVKTYQSRNPDVFVAFLTAIPRHNDVPWAFWDKVLWAQQYFPGIPVFFGPMSTDKHIHCEPGDILIDDRKTNNDDWINAGGRAHMYTEWPECKQWLEKELGTI